MKVLAWEAPLHPPFLESPPVSARKGWEEMSTPMSQWSTCLEPDLEGNHDVEVVHCLPCYSPSFQGRLLDKARFVMQN
jgi:hypothetical protein